MIGLQSELTKKRQFDNSTTWDETLIRVAYWRQKLTTHRGRKHIKNAAMIMKTSKDALRSFFLLASSCWMFRTEPSRLPSWASCARAFICLFAVLQTDQLRKRITTNGPRRVMTVKNTFLVFRTSLLRSHPFSQKYTSGLYTNIPYPRNGPMDSGIGMSYMRSTNNILGEVTVPSYVNGDLTIALYRS